MSELGVQRALVTGGAGFIGSHLVDALLAGDVQRVAVVDNMFLGREANLIHARHAPDRVVLYREDAGDAAAMAAICDAEAPDIVFNLATKALPYSFFNPSGAFDVNVRIALTLAELQRRGAFRRLIQISSSEVYGSAQFTPMHEGHPLLAETTYAAGKAAADLALASYCRMFDADVVTVRPFNNYGPRQNKGQLAGVVPTTMNRILLGQAPILDGDGTQTRDFIFVADTVAAILKLSQLDEVRGEVFNVGSGSETSVSELIERICRAAGYTGPIERRAARAADVLRHCADVTKAVTAIGPVAATPLDEGLGLTWEWYHQGRLV